MAITIRQYENKWRIEIVNEMWEWETLEDMKLSLDKLLKMKEDYGRIKDKVVNI